MHTKFWSENLKRKRRKSRCRWKDNIGLYLKKMGWEGEDWINLAQDMDQWWAVTITVMNIRVS